MPKDRGRWFEPRIAAVLLGTLAAPVAATLAQPVPTLVSGVGIEDAPPAVGGGQFTEIPPGTPLPSGSRVRTGVGGGATWRWDDGSQATLHAGSELWFEGTRRMADLTGAPAGGEVPLDRQGLGFTPADSAIKAILTHNDAALALPEANPEVKELSLRRGALTAQAAGGTALRVRFVGGAVIARDAHFTLTAGRDDSARLTVARGHVAVLSADGGRSNPAAGQFVEVRPGAGVGGPTVTAPRPTTGDRAAAADLVALRSGPAPADPSKNPVLGPPDYKHVVRVDVTPTSLPPAPAPAPGVGSGLSSPFDFPGNDRNATLLAPPNPVNILGPVNSPERSD